MGQQFAVNLQHLDPIDPDLGLLAGLVVGFGLPAFLFRRQSSCRFVRLHGWLALFSLEAIVLVAQTLYFFGLLLDFGVQGFHQIHQINDHLAQRFILNAVGIQIF